MSKAAPASKSPFVLQIVAGVCALGAGLFALRSSRRSTLDLESLTIYDPLWILAIMSATGFATVLILQWMQRRKGRPSRGLAAAGIWLTLLAMVFLFVFRYPIEPGVQYRRSMSVNPASGPDDRDERSAREYTLRFSAGGRPQADYSDVDGGSGIAGSRRAFPLVGIDAAYECETGRVLWLTGMRVYDRIKLNLTDLDQKTTTPESIAALRCKIVDVHTLDMSRYNSERQRFE